MFRIQCPSRSVIQQCHKPARKPRDGEDPRYRHERKTVIVVGFHLSICISDPKSPVMAADSGFKRRIWVWLAAPCQQSPHHLDSCRPCLRRDAAPNSPESQGVRLPRLYESYMLFSYTLICTSQNGGSSLMACSETSCSSENPQEQAAA